MFEEYAKSTDLINSKKRYLLIIPAALAFCVIIASLAFLFGLRSKKQEREFRR
ncbi:MAG: hypothetical protein WBC70_01725 [Candidatus Aminicenantales bacterium]